MSPHDEGVQAQSSDLTQTTHTDYTQNNSEAKNDIQSKKEGGRDSQNSSEESNRNKSQERDYERENDDGKEKMKEHEESNDEHNNEGKEESEQQSGDAESSNGVGNGGSKHPKVSKEALEGPQSPAPTTKYNFDEEAKNGMCWFIIILSLHRTDRYQMAPVRSPVKIKPTNPRIRRKTQTIRKTSPPSTSTVGPWGI